MTYIPRSSSSVPGAMGTTPVLIQKKRTFNIFNTLATLFFVLSIMGAVGVYFLGRYTENKLNAARVALEQVSSSDDKGRVDAIGVFDQRLEMANVLMGQHLSPLKIFNKFEDLTKETVRLSDFIYDYQPGFEATLGFSVNTSELSSVALQRLSLAADSLFSNFTMKDIAMESGVEGGEKKANEEVSGVEAKFAGVLNTAQFAYNPTAPAEAEAAQAPSLSASSSDASSTVATSSEEVNE